MTSDAAARPVFLTAAWRWLLMLSWEIDPAVLAPLAPAGTEPDTFQGRSLVSVVGFQFRETRVLGVPVPLHRHFDEVNLRFYVRRRGPEGWRRGVVFVRELVPRRAIAWLANAVYHEHYLALPMRHALVPPSAVAGTAGRVEYAWRRGGRWERIAAAFDGAPALAADDAEEGFVSEHYWGYGTRRPRAGSGALEYRVEHPRWRVWHAREAVLEADVAMLYGPRFAPFLRGAPSSAFVADGSEVIVRRAVKLG